MRITTTPNKHAHRQTGKNVLILKNTILRVNGKTVNFFRKNNTNNISNAEQCCLIMLSTTYVWMVLIITEILCLPVQTHFLYLYQNNSCFINRYCFASNEPNPTDWCYQCLPDVSNSIWTKRRGS